MVADSKSNCTPFSPAPYAHTKADSDAFPKLGGKTSPDAHASLIAGTLGIESE